MSMISPRRTVTGSAGELPGLGSRQSLLGTAVLIVPALLIASRGGLYWQTIVGLGAAYLVAALGYNVALGYGRQFVFCQAGFMATGAYAYALCQARGWSGWAGAVAALVVSVAFAVIIGVTTARLREGYLALVTLSFSQALLLIVSLWPATGGDNGIAVSLDGYQAPLIGVVVTALILLGIDRLMRSRAGRSMIMVGADEQAATAMGVPVARTRVGILVVSALLGGAAGVILAGTLSFISTADFTIETTLLLLTIIVVGGLASIWGTVFGTILLVAVQQYLANSFPGLAAFIYAGILFLVLIVRPGGLSSVMHRRPRAADMAFLRRLSAEAGHFAARLGADRVGGGTRRTAREPERAVSPSPESAGPRPGSAESPASAGAGPDSATPQLAPDAGSARPGALPLLEISDVSVDFGGVHAVSRASLVLAEGEFLAVVGPNGAGKSTLLNAISGLVTLSSGSIVMRGHPLDRLRGNERAARGIARTFQHARLFDGLTAADQVLCGQYAAGGYRFWDVLARTPRFIRAEARAMSMTMELLARLHIERVAFSDSHEISGPEARLVGLARALIGDPQVLLLDEIAAACTEEEKDYLCGLLLKVREQQGLAAMIVEHDLNFVRMLADRVIFMADGHVLASGTPDEVFSRQDVLDAYVGTSRLEPKVD
jgi:branched-chain amino acid transport system permease protein